MTKNWRRNVAEFVSFVANPALIVVVGMAVITSQFADTNEQFWRWTAIGSFLLVGPSLLYVAYSWKKVGKIDIDVSKREDRIVPLLISSLGALFGSYLVQSRLGNETLTLFSNILSAMMLTMTIVTLVWKISLHAASLTAMITLMVLFRDPQFAWLYLLILPVAWARLFLHQHTPAQIVAGSLTGAGVTFLASVLFHS